MLEGVEEALGDRVVAALPVTLAARVAAAQMDAERHVVEAVDTALSAASERVKFSSGSSPRERMPASISPST